MNRMMGGTYMLDQSYYEKADEIIARYGKKPSALIPVMQDMGSKEVAKAIVKDRNVVNK